MSRAGLGMDLLEIAGENVWILGHGHGPVWSGTREWVEGSAA